MINARQMNDHRRRLFALVVSIALIATGVLFNFPVSVASAATLGVTRITAVQTYATADGTFDNGWQWVFDVTVPENETVLNMKFSDWTSGLNTIVAANHIRFYSSQSSNASDADHAILITASGTYGEIMNLNQNVDLDAIQAGRQIQVIVEASAPVGSSGGSYSTSYGIKTDADPNSVVIPTYHQADITFSEPESTVSSETGLRHTEFSVTIADLTSVQDTAYVRYKLTLTKNDFPLIEQRISYFSTGDLLPYFSGAAFTTNDTGSSYIDPVYGRLLNIGSMTSMKSLAGLTTYFSTDHLYPGNYKIQFSVVQVNGDGSYTELTQTHSKEFIIAPNLPGTLNISLAANPSSGFVMKGETASTIGLNFGAEQNIATIYSIILQGTADVGDGQSFANFDDVVSSCGLYDRDVLVKAKNPTTEGLMAFNSIELIIPAGQTKTLTAKCKTLSSINSTNTFAVGLNAVSVQDGDGNGFIISLNNAENQLKADGDSPEVFQTVNKPGTLTISKGSEPESTIVLGNSDVKFAEFRATAFNEPVLITKIHVTSTGNAASLTELKIRVKGSTDVIGTAVLAAGTNSVVTSTLTTPVTVDKDSTKTIEIWGTTGTVVKPSATSGAKSGSTIALSVLSRNIEAYGTSSGERIIITSPNVTGNMMVLRKSKPTVTVQSIGSTLSSGVQKDLIKFQVSADSVGDIAWKKMDFTITTTTHVTGFQIFKLYRGTSDITTDSIASLTYNGSSHVLTLILKDGKEEVVSGSGQQYTISGTPVLASPVSGDSITTKITEEVGDLITGDYATIATSSHFVWTDLSVPGSPNVTNNDWTNGVYVKDLTTQSALVY